MTASLPSLSGARGAALLQADLLRARTLSILRDVVADEAGTTFLELLEALTNDESPARIGSIYGRLFALLADEAELTSEPLVGDAWQNHLLDRLLETNPPSTRRAHRAAPDGLSTLGRAFLARGRRDLAALQALFSLAAPRLAKAAAHAANADPADAWVPWSQ